MVLVHLLVHCATVPLLSNADRAHLGKIDFEVSNASCFLLFALGTLMPILGSEHHNDESIDFVQHTSPVVS